MFYYLNIHPQKIESVEIYNAFSLITNCSFQKGRQLPIQHTVCVYTKRVCNKTCRSIGRLNHQFKSLDRKEVDWLTKHMTGGDNYIL